MQRVRRRLSAVLSPPAPVLGPPPEVRTASAVLNIVEIDLGRPRYVESVEMACDLQDAALSLVALAGRP